MFKLAAQSSRLGVVGTLDAAATMTGAVTQQQTRNIRIRKPPWVPRAKNKQFRVPPLHIPDASESAYMRPIW